MRKITTLLLVGLTLMFAAEGFAQRGIGTNLPDRSSVLELKSESRGLLIPRVELEATDDPAPIANPANSLLVYNTGTTPEDTANPGVDLVGEGLTGVRPGYYFWKRDNDANATPGQWIPLLNTAGKNIEIDDDGVVSVKPGETHHQVLVTTVNVDETDVNNPITTTTTEWVNASEILETLLGIEGDNGITVGEPIVDLDTGITTFTVELGGALIKETIITASAGEEGEDDNSLTIESGQNYFHITNLNEIKVGENGNLYVDGATEDDDPTPTGDVFQDTFDVLIVDKDTGLVQRVSVEDLLKDAVAVANGLWYDPSDGLIKLGGPLIEETTIKLDGNDFVIETEETTVTEGEGDDATTTVGGNLKIKGLDDVDAANKIMVVEDDGTVRTVRRVISKEITHENVATVFTPDPNNPNDPNAYSPYVHEVNINVTALGAETDLVLPAASAANEGQVINIRLTIEEESGNYLNIKKEAGTVTDNTNILTWGALPFQGWVLKSVGGANNPQWLVVSSN